MTYVSNFQSYDQKKNWWQDMFYYGKDSIKLNLRLTGGFLRLKPAYRGVKNYTVPRINTAVPTVHQKFLRGQILHTGFYCSDLNNYK